MSFLSFDQVLEYKDIRKECEWLHESCINGGALHIVCEDGNYKDSDLDYCIKYIESGEYSQRDDAVDVGRQLSLAKALRAISEAHREMVDCGNTMTEEAFEVLARQDVKTQEAMEKIYEIAIILDRAERTGAAVDSPEGSRVITISDTMANKLANNIQVALKKIDDAGRNL